MHESELPFQEPLPTAAPATGPEDDSELRSVIEYLYSQDPKGEKIAAALRRTFDMLLDGLNTGRYRWDQLHKTEKTHFGTLVEINLQREFEFQDGEVLDYRICGIEVDCKYSQKRGNWMLPPEVVGRLCLGLWASDSESVWSAGLFRAEADLLSEGNNRDAKHTLSKEGRASVQWLFQRAPLPPNALLHMPEEDVDAIFKGRSGAERVRELFRRAQGLRISRTVVATVAEQDDYMKRVRANGGARSTLRDEGIVILGQYSSHCEIASGFDLPEPGPGEFVSVRVAPAEGERTHRPQVLIDGSWWHVADEEEPAITAPALPEVKKSG